jgi:hypothetical protein
MRLLPRIRIVEAAARVQAPARLVVEGECHDPAHRGLERLVREYPSIDPDDTSWAGQEVELLHLQLQRLIAENRDLQLGRRDRSANFRAAFAIGAAAGIGFLWVLAVLLGGRPW